MEWYKLENKSISNNKYVRMKWNVPDGEIKGAILAYEIECIGLYIDDMFIPTYLDNKYIDKKTLINYKAKWKDLINEN